MNPNKPLKIGFGPGAETIFANFSGELKTANLAASIQTLQGGCYGTVAYSRPTELVHLFGEPYSESAQHHVLIVAEADPDVRYFRGHRKRKSNGVLVIKIRYNPTLSGRCWKDVYAMLLMHFRKEYVFRFDPQRKQRETITAFSLSKHGAW